jgi:toxin HigB-1
VDILASFKNKGTEDIFNGKNTTAARKTCPESLWEIAVPKLDQPGSVVLLDERRVPPGNWPETLGGGRIGQRSASINERYLICFRGSESGPEQVEIVDYH